MKIRMIRPLPRIDHVIPAGFVLDAPEGFARKMVRTGRAVFVGGGEKAPELEKLDRAPQVPEEIQEAPEEAAEVPEEIQEAPEEAAEAPVESPEEAPEETEEKPPVKKTTRSRKGSADGRP
ncbi:MAG: hypothetical protein IJ229_14765 [Clostridia bacterium]|nr:hypothetical protein [Clostridia bacterium]